VTSSQNNTEQKELHKMSTVREDPIKLHKDANALMENGKYAEARDLFVKVADLYYKGQNYFGAAEMTIKQANAVFH